MDINSLDIINFRVNNGLTQQALANELNVSLKTIQNWEAGKTIPSTKMKLIRNYIINKSNITQKENISDPTIINNIEVPYYDVDFSGGWKSENLFTTHQPSFFISNPEFDKAEFACNLVGNSISRLIPSGAIIGLKEIKDWEIYFPGNEVYAVVMKNKLRTVKIIKKSSDKKHLILIPSPLDEHNKTGYETEEVPIDFIDKFFQVVAWGQFEKLAQ